MTRLSCLFWISLVVVMVLVGCGGGSGGSGGDEGGGPSEQERRAERDRAFMDEAVERVLDRSRLSCTELTCDGAGRLSEGEVPQFDSISASCTYDCLPVEIDLSEQRFYQVALRWRRTSTTCFVKADYEPVIVAHVRIPCTPTE